MHAAYVDGPDEEAEQGRGHAAGGEHERWRPYFLVDGEAVAQQPAAERQHEAHEQQAQSAVAVVADLHYEASAPEADHHMHNRWDGGEYTLGVDGYAHAVDLGIIHMCVGEHRAVGYGEDVGLVGSITVGHKEHDAVDRERGHDYNRQPAVAQRHGKQRADAVAYCQAREHTKNADVAEVHRGLPERLTLYNKSLGEERQPRQTHADSEDKHRALQNLPRQRSAQPEIELAQRDKRGDTHDEHEEGENEVCGRQTIPRRMFERRVGARTAGIVYENHAGHGDAAHYIDGQDAPRLARLGVRLSPGVDGRYRSFGDIAGSMAHGIFICKKQR